MITAISNTKGIKGTVLIEKKKEMTSLS